MGFTARDLILQLMSYPGGVQQQEVHVAGPGIAPYRIVGTKVHDGRVVFEITQGEEPKKKRKGAADGRTD